MERAGAYFHVQGLEDDTALLRPKLLQREDEALEGVEVGCFIHVYAILPVT